MLPHYIIELKGRARKHMGNKWPTISLILSMGQIQNCQNYQLTATSFALPSPIPCGEGKGGQKATELEATAQLLVDHTVLEEVVSEPYGLNERLTDHN